MYKVVSRQIRGSEFQENLDDFAKLVKPFIDDGYVPLGAPTISDQSGAGNWFFISQALWFDPINNPEKLL